MQNLFRVDKSISLLGGTHVVALRPVGMDCFLCECLAPHLNGFQAVINFAFLKYVVQVEKVSANVYHTRNWDNNRFLERTPEGFYIISEKDNNRLCLLNPNAIVQIVGRVDGKYQAAAY